MSLPIAVYQPGKPQEIKFAVPDSQGEINVRRIIEWVTKDVPAEGQFLLA